ncbi:MAG: hypothetical protein WA861_08025, partial [Candidatus Binatus sp.]
RALAGFVRPYAQATHGTPRKMKFDRVTGLFDFTFEAAPGAEGATEIFVPHLQYPGGCEIEVIGGAAEPDLDHQRVMIRAAQAGEVRVVICRKP